MAPPDPHTPAPRRDAAIRRPLRDLLLFPALLIYLGLLVLAAWMDPVRPAWLDRPRAAAVDLLELAGVRAGITVFRAERDGDLRVRGYCVFARARDGVGELHSLYPAGGHCRESGLRLRVPADDLALSLMLQQGAYHHLAAGGGKAETNLARRDAVLRRLGDTFCSAPMEPPPQEISLLWTTTSVSYHSGRLGRLANLQLRYACAPARIAEQVWFAGNDEMLRFWGGSPWE